MSKPLTRRNVLAGGMLAGTWAIAGGARSTGGSPNEKLNVACIGVGGRGEVNLQGVQGENVVALCDVDEKRAAASLAKYPRAKKHQDFRRMLDAMDRQIDAVVVSTPDHTHAVASVLAMQHGKHCYCEKPLAHDVGEVRTMAELAAARKLATQQGTQRHCWGTFHRVVELVQSGVIGPVRECHAWVGGNRGGGRRPSDTPPVPSHLQWDLWLGPAPARPYHPVYAPYGWRFWWDFGTGETGNLGCHTLDLPFSALGLVYPVSVEAEGPPVDRETTPTWMSVRYQFPARGTLPPLTLTWQHGKRPTELLSGEKPNDWRSAVLFVGEKGMLLADLLRWKLLPESRFRDIRPVNKPLPIASGFSWEPDSRRHYEEWIAACKTGSPTSCHFGYAGPLTETVLLGNVAYRVGEKFSWDAKNVRPIGCPKAEALIRRSYRRGWSLLMR